MGIAESMVNDLLKRNLGNKNVIKMLKEMRHKALSLASFIEKAVDEYETKETEEETGTEEATDSLTVCICCQQEQKHSSALLLDRLGPVCAMCVMVAYWEAQ